MKTSIAAWILTVAVAGVAHATDGEATPEELAYMTTLAAELNTPVDTLRYFVVGGRTHTYRGLHVQLKGLDVWRVRFRSRLRAMNFAGSRATAEAHMFRYQLVEVRGPQVVLLERSPALLDAQRLIDTRRAAWHTLPFRERTAFLHVQGRRTAERATWSYTSDGDFHTSCALRVARSKREPNRETFRGYRFLPPHSIQRYKYGSLKTISATDRWASDVATRDGEAPALITLLNHDFEQEQRRWREEADAKEKAAREAASTLNVRPTGAARGIMGSLGPKAAAR
jgi:hypothetical protein